MSSLGLKESYVGSQAQALRGILAISHPIRQGAVQDWDDLEVRTLSMCEITDWTDCRRSGPTSASPSCAPSRSPSR